MKSKRKALLLSVCAVLMMTALVFGTFAYLTDSESVTNTFTVGSVGLKLDEAKVNTDGTPVPDADRVKENEYHLLPGMTYTKDPTIHVSSDSEDCWLFVKITKGANFTLNGMPEGWSREMWYTDAILWAEQNRIVAGYGNGLYGPEDAVTREQMAAIFYRYSQYKGYSLTEGNYDHFTDKDTVSAYAQTAMRWAVGNGLLVGMADGTLSPKSDTTRAEFAAMIQRFVETIVK